MIHTCEEVDVAGGYTLIAPADSAVSAHGQGAAATSQEFCVEGPSAAFLEAWVVPKDAQRPPSLELYLLRRAGDEWVNVAYSLVPGAAGVSHVRKLSAPGCYSWAVAHDELRDAGAGVDIPAAFDFYSHVY